MGLLHDSLLTCPAVVNFSELLVCVVSNALPNILDVGLPGAGPNLNLLLPIVPLGLLFSALPFALLSAIMELNETKQRLPLLSYH